MTSGPPPKPTALRLLHGDRKSSINAREPATRSLPPTAPDGIADDVRAIWDYTLAGIIYMNIAADVDRDALICYCEAVVAHRKASAILAKSPILIKGQMGGMVRNPALAVQRDAATTIRGYCQEFGLTPSARTRIQTDAATPRADDINPFAATG